MEDTQHINPQSGRIERLTATWRALDKRKWATVGGVVVTIGALVVTGLRKGVPWYMAHKE
jgi:hypothetical protein